MVNQDFRIKHGSFEGPLDLLLSLVEKRKMHISDLSLAAITDDYVHFLSANPIPIGQTAEFIFLAATLMLIKSRSLLPGFSITKEEEADIAVLEGRLAHYQAIKGAAAMLSLELAKPRRFFRRPSAPLPKEASFRPGTDGASLAKALHAAITRTTSLMPTREKIPQTRVEKKIRLEEVMQSLLLRAKESLGTTLRGFTGSGKAETILGFLALLELVKQGTIKVSQNDHFSDITIESLSLGVPAYL
ncbi:MAG: segregation/condensation protein A [Patescibacteria group bacterium]